MIDFPSSPVAKQVVSTALGDFVWTGTTWMFTENKLWSKAAVWPGDVYTADPLMPAFATTTADRSTMLTYCEIGRAHV